MGENPWDSMMKVHRYKHHTVFAKVCPNGEMYFESYPNSEVDKGLEDETIPSGDRWGDRGCGRMSGGTQHDPGWGDPARGQADLPRKRRKHGTGS